jgi:hypothetical protein
MDRDSGNAANGASGFAGAAEDLTAGVDVGAGDAAGAGAGVDFAGAVVVVVGGAVVVVVESFVDGDDGSTLDVAAPAGARLANTLTAPRTRAPISTAIDKRGFRLKVLLLLCMGYTGPALSPTLGLYPAE